ncbi:MAG: methionine gamma-lyase family protein [Corallococcus sp.]|nr:methionine gamma-lyase family protein [Corallococcus sp.]
MSKVVSEVISDIINNALDNCQSAFKRIDKIALSNQRKVLNAFRNNGVALRHFEGSSGYGYDDNGRDILGKIYAEIFDTEKAIVSPLITSGTHALTIALFGVLRPNDVMLSVSGEPYDTLRSVIHGDNIGSLKDFGVEYRQVNLIDGQFDFESIRREIEQYRPKVVYLQRSRGYEWRDALSVEKISRLVEFVRKYTDCCIMVDNCYGEFVEEHEPTNVGADVCIGSLIKNIGGGISPTGGYIVGKSLYVDVIAGRFIAPSVGSEVGSYAYGYRNFYQGLFLAPHTVAQAIKTATLFSFALSNLGYDVKPMPNENFYDIVCSVKFNNKEKLVAFCQSIQKFSPVDSFAVPEPWDMPGYGEQVIMAAGCFVQGASIELSCDSPIKPPYIAYLQGGLTLEHGILALEEALQSLLSK